MKKRTERLGQCACGQFIVTTGLKPRTQCDDCKNSSQGHKGGLLYNTWSVNYRKLWPTFMDFYMEVGEPPLGMMLTGAVPGTRPSPGNVKWVEKQAKLPPKEFETTTDYEAMLINDELKDLAKAAFTVKNKVPSAAIGILDQLEAEFTALKREDTESWQLELERMANDYSIQLKREADLELAGMGRGSQTRVGREFRNKLAPVLALRMEEHHKSALTGRSGRHFNVIGPAIEGMDYLTVAHITVTTVLDNLGRGSAVVSPLSKTYDEIGARIDHQKFLETVKQYDPRAFERIDRWVLKRTTAGYSHKINEAKAYAQDVTYNFLSNEDRLALGDWAFHCFQSITRWFDTLKFFENAGKSMKTTYFLSLSEEGLKWRDLIQAGADDRAFEAWPMVHPPLEWELDEEGKAELRGGYLKAHPGKLCTLVRGNKGSIPSDVALAALHKTQSQAFRINQFIYETCKGLLLKSEEIGKFCSYERDSWDATNRPLIDPSVWDLPKDENHNPHPEVRKAKRLLSQWHSNRKKVERERVAPFRVLMVAARFKNVDRFYLPCFFDNRLRMYYMVDTLNPQGSDYQKALLQFADGYKVTPENSEKVRRDLLITLANTWANKEDGIKTDKLSLDGRASFSEAFLKELEGVAKDPLTTASKALWTAASEPFQFLATVREYFEIFVWKTSDVARVANGRDATNSGSQILGAIIRDPKTCIYTNVVPTDAPMDLYGEVAKEAQALLRNYGWIEKEQKKATKRAQKRVQRMQEQGVEDYVIDPSSLVFRLDPSVVDRSVCKRASMCTAYGASWESKNEYVSEELDDIEGVKASLCDKIIVTNAVIEGQAAAFPKMEEVNRWFKQVAKACLDKGLTYVSWTTPNGSKVVQEYRERKIKEVTTYAMGGGAYWQPTAHNGARGKDRSKIGVQTGWGAVKESKTQTALGANWTHSHDACIVQKTVCDWETPFYAVHDCFYGPAGTMEDMCKKARVAFYETVTSDPFGELIRHNEIDLAKPLEGVVRLQDCLFSDYMFS